MALHSLLFFPIFSHNPNMLTTHSKIQPKLKNTYKNPNERERSCYNYTLLQEIEVQKVQQLSETNKNQPP